MVRVLLIYTISISILCVLWEGPSLIQSNQQICDFYKLVIFKKERHYGTMQSKFLISANEHITGCVNIYLYECVSLLALICVVCDFVCVCVCVCVCVNV